MSRLNLWKPEPKRRAGIVRPAVVPGVALSKYTNTELGVRIARRSNLPKQDPGVAWARLMNSANRPEKDVARQAVLNLFTKERFPTLSILTFPASQWRFETALLTMRGEAENKGPANTRIVAIERDVAIYRAACHNMPACKSRGQKSLIRTPPCPDFASACTQSAKIQNFYQCHFEDYAGYNSSFHGAWLDFNGQLSPSRLSAIEVFWKVQLRRLDSLLVVTLLNARTCDWITARIRHHGGLEQLLQACLAGSEIEDVLEYGDGAPMRQVVLRKTTL